MKADKFVKQCLGNQIQKRNLASHAKPGVNVFDLPLF